MTGKFSFKTMGIIIALLLALFCAQAYTQDNVKDKPEQRNSLFGGSWSMQFKFMHDFILTDFEGALISAKRHFTDKSALRFGLNLGFSFEDAEAQQPSDRNHFYISTSVQYIFYTSPKAPINFYIGFGPHIGFERYKLYFNDSDDEYNYSRNWDVGLLGTWGVEWFLKKQISLICEYGASLDYNSALSESQGNTSYSSKEIHEFKMRSHEVDFGISVYF